MPSDTPTKEPVRGEHRYGEWAILVALWATGQFVVVILFGRPWGIDRGADTSTYLEWAKRFPGLESVEWGYAGFVIILKASTTLGVGVWGILALNFVATVTASWLLLLIGRREFGSVAGWIAASTYLLHPLVSQWFKYALTDALFTAGVIASAWACWRLQFTRGLRDWTLLTTIVLATSSLRPTGLVLVGAAYSVAAVISASRTSTRVVLYCSVWVLVAAASFVIPSSAGTSDAEAYSLLSRAVTGEIVYGDANRALVMPKSSQQGISNIDYLAYIAEHPIDNARLFASKIAWELAQVRPWYSAELNLYLVVFMTLLYLIAIVGLVQRASRGFALGILGLSIPFITFIGATWAIYEGRFAWWFLALWLVPFGGGTQNLLEQVRRVRVRGR